MSPSRTSASGPPTNDSGATCSTQVAIRRAAHPRIRDAHHVADALLQQFLRDRQHAPLGHAGAAERPRLLQDEHGVSGHGQGRVVDAGCHVVVVAKDHCPARMDEQLGIRRRLLDDGAFRCEVAPEHGDATLMRQWALTRTNHLVVVDLRVAEAGAKRLATDRRALEVEQVLEAPHQAAKTSGVIEVFHQKAARRPDIGEHRRAARHAIEVVEIERHTCAARHRNEVHDGVGRSAQRHRHRDRVVECRGSEHVSGLHILPHQIDDAPACGGGHASVRGVGGGNRRCAGKRQAQRFRGGGHCRRRAHRHAGAVGARDAVLHPVPRAVVQCAGATLGPELPHVASAGQGFPLVVAAQHRAGGNEDRRQVHRRGAHDEAGHCLVAAAEQDDAVDRVGAKKLLCLHREQIAIEHRARLHQRLAQRYHRHFDREPTSLPHAALDLVCAQAQVRVAGIEVAPRVQDADDGLAGVVLGGKPHLLRAGSVSERAKVVDAEPSMRAERFGCETGS